MTDKPASWADIQRRMRDAGAYDAPFDMDSMLVDPETGLPMNEEHARAYAEVEQQALNAAGSGLDDESALPTS